MSRRPPNRSGPRVAQGPRAVLGVIAPPPRPTALGAFWVACVVTLPLAALWAVVTLLAWLL